MIVVTGGRASGKTSAVIRWLLENIQHRAIIVADRREAEHVLYMIRDAAKIKYDFRPHVIAAQDLQIGGYHRGQSMRALHFPEVAIDDATRVFKVLFGVDLDFMSVNATWIPLAPPDDVVKVKLYTDKELEATRPGPDPEWVDAAIVGEIRSEEYTEDDSPFDERPTPPRRPGRYKLRGND
jgi:hypothetical protein